MIHPGFIFAMIAASAIIGWLAGRAYRRHGEGKRLLELLQSANDAANPRYRTVTELPEPSGAMDMMTATAYHEAGHAVAAWCSPSLAYLARLRVVNVATQQGLRTGDLLGVVKPVYRLGAPTLLEDRLVMALAGLAAELEYSGRVEIASMNRDLDMAEYYASRLTAMHGAQLSERLTIGFLEDCAPDGLPIRDIFRPDLSPAVLDLLDYGYRRALYLVRAFESKCHALVLRTKDGADLDSRQLAEILGVCDLGKPRWAAGSAS